MDKVQNNRHIFLSPPHMGGQELDFVRVAFESNYIAPLGPMVDAFEQEFAEKVRIPHAVAVSSGTAAMPRLNMPQLNKSIKAFNGVNLAVLRNLTG